MSDKTRENWERIDPALRQKCVDHLRTLPRDLKDDLTRAIQEHPGDWYTRDMTPPEERKRIKAEYGFYIPAPFHFSLGMGIRNYLREIVRDVELPFVKYKGGHSYQNWDDYYTAAIEDALKTD